MSDIEGQKRRSGEAAAALVQDGMTVGLGTGSTAVYLVKALGARAAIEGLKLRCVATSQATAALAESLGLPLVALDDAGRIDLTIDGADEIGPGLSLIKGGGAALLREKLVWEASRRCVVIADAAKVVPQLGKFPLPIEVVAFGHRTTALRICDALAEADIGIAPRLRIKDGALKSVTGVVDHGLFLDMADEAIIGTDHGVERLAP